MTIKVRYHKGVFEPVTPITNASWAEGEEFDIEIIDQPEQGSLKGIVGLFEDLSLAEIKQFETASARRDLFDKPGIKE